MRTLFLLLASIPLFGNTIVQQTVVNPNGTPASGYVYLKATQTCVSGANFLGNAVITVRFTAGAFSVSLIPNDTCVPAGSAYAVTWQITGGQASTEYWVVPTSSTPLNVSQVRSALPPSPSLLFNPAQLSRASATPGQCLIWSGTSWGPAACAAASSVLSIFGRMGAVTAQTGDYTTSQITENGNLYFTLTRARAALSAASPISYNAATGVFSCPTCSDGSIASVFGRSGAITGQAGDYTTTLVAEGTNLYFTMARARAALSATSPIAYNSTTGVISCSTCGTSTGDMSASVYDPANLASQVEVVAHKNMADGFAGLDGSQKLSIAQIPTGITSSTVPFGNDARFSDARTPTAHATSHKNGGSDEVATATPGANLIPKADSGGKLNSGWIPTLNQGTSGNAATATALAANGSNCPAGQVAAGVDAGGAAEGCVPLTYPIPFSFDGVGSPLPTNKTVYFRQPAACTIVDWSISSTTAETVTVKVWKVATGTAIPTGSNSISTSGVSLSTGTHIRSATLSDFTTTAVAANDILAATLTAVTASQYVNVTLGCRP